MPRDKRHSKRHHRETESSSSSMSSDSSPPTKIHAGGVSQSLSSRSGRGPSSRSRGRKSQEKAEDLEAYIEREVQRRTVAATAAAIQAAQLNAAIAVAQQQVPMRHPSYRDVVRQQVPAQQPSQLRVAAQPQVQAQPKQDPVQQPRVQSQAQSQQVMPHPSTRANVSPMVRVKHAKIRDHLRASQSSVLACSRDHTPDQESQKAKTEISLRTDPRGWTSCAIESSRVILESPLEYQICRRTAKIAIGIFRDRLAAIAGIYEPMPPLLLQFGYSGDPHGAEGLVIGDRIYVNEYQSLAEGRSEMPRGFQSANAPDPSVFFGADGRTVVPCCLALHWTRREDSCGTHYEEIGVITDFSYQREPIVPGKQRKYRWEIQLVSQSFQKDVTANNSQIAGRDHNNPWGFELAPSSGNWTNVHYYPVQKNQTLLIGDLIVPEDYRECAEVCKKSSYQIMWIETVPTHKVQMIKRNAGLGRGDHNELTYRSEYRTICECNTAIVAYERVRQLRQTRRVVLTGKINKFLDDHEYIMDVKWSREPSELDLQACHQYLRASVWVQLRQQSAGGGFRNMFRAVVIKRFLRDGRVASLHLKRITSKYYRQRERPLSPSRDKTLTFQLVNEEGEIEYDSDQDSLEIEEVPSKFPKSREEKEKSDWDAPGRRDDDFFKQFRYPTEDIRIVLSEEDTGQEGRITLLANAPRASQAYDSTFQKSSSMRAELIATLVPLKWIRGVSGFNWLPTRPDIAPRFHIPGVELEQSPGPGDWIEGDVSVEYTEPKLTPIPGFNHKYGGDNLYPLREEITQDESLNDEQKLFVLSVGFHLVPAVYLQSPAGSGKTSTLAKLVKYLAKYRPDDLVLVVASTNHATQNLAGKIHLALGYVSTERACSPELLMIKSQMATVFDTATEGAEIAEENEFLLSCNVEAHIQKILQDVKSGEIPPGMISKSNLKAAEFYLEVRARYPGCLATDTDMIGIILSVQSKLSIVVTTIGKAMQIARHLHRTKIILCDEAHQARAVDLQNLVWSTETQQMAFAGDSRQLSPYAHRDFEKLNRDQYARHSIVEFFHRWLPGMMYELKKVYRFHPAMVPAISSAFYGGSLIAAAVETDRNFVATFRVPMSSSQVPITLIDVKDPPSEGVGKSLRNFKQEEVAKNLIIIISQMCPNCSIVVECYYTATANAVEEWVTYYVRAVTLHGVKITVHTVHAYIGQEADFVITLSTRNQVTKGWFDFVRSAKIACVALTRARHGQWVIGNMDYLTQKSQNPDMNPDARQETAIGRYVRGTIERAPPLNDVKFLEYLKREVFTETAEGEIPSIREGYQPRYHARTKLLLNLRNESLTATCEAAQEAGWYPADPARYPHYGGGFPS